MGCQRAIVRDIVQRKADYVISLKGNQGTLHREVRDFFEDAEKDGFKDTPHAFTETIDGDHGRIETRRCWCTGSVDWFADRREWPGIPISRGTTGEQLRRALSSALLRYTEGFYAQGGSQGALWAGARASCGEAAAAVLVLAIEGRVPQQQTEDVRALLARAMSMLTKLARRT